jgi:hypothetical protein
MARATGTAAQMDAWLFDGAGVVDPSALDTLIDLELKRAK